MRAGKAGLTTFLILWPGISPAHGLGGSVGYQLTLQSMLESVSPPVILLLLIGFALLAGTSGEARSRFAAAGLAVGLVAGIPVSPWLGPYGAVVGLVIGATCSLLAAAIPAAVPKVLLATLGLATGFAASVYNLDGHPQSSLPFAAHLGIVLGPLIMCLVITGWLAVLMQASRHSWVPILFRIVSSWSFAANAIYLAFQLKSGG